MKSARDASVVFCVFSSAKTVVSIRHVRNFPVVTLEIILSLSLSVFRYVRYVLSVESLTRQLMAEIPLFCSSFLDPRSVGRSPGAQATSLAPKKLRPWPINCVESSSLPAPSSLQLVSSNGTPVLTNIFFDDCIGADFTGGCGFRSLFGRQRRFPVWSRG